MNNLIQPNTELIQPGELLFKQEHGLRYALQLPVDATLLDIIQHISTVHGALVTETYRDPLHPDDLHGILPMRAWDIRAWCYKDRQAIHDIAREVNAMWTYDPSRPTYKCMLVHRNRASIGIHAHIQVHPNTRRNNQS